MYEFLLSALQVDVPTYLGLIFAAVAVVGLVVYSKSFIKKNQFTGLLDQKDKVIDTYRQTIDSLHGHIQEIDQKLQQVILDAEKAHQHVDKLEKEITAQRKLYNELKHWAAPEAVKRLEAGYRKQEEILESRNERLDKIKDDLEYIKTKLTEPHDSSFNSPES